MLSGNNKEHINEDLVETTETENKEAKESVLIPNLGEQTEYNKYTEGNFTKEAINSNKIKNVLIKSTTELEYPAYMIDITNVDVITDESLKAIASLLGGGDTTVYIKNGDKIDSAGKGDGTTLYKLLELVVNNMYKGKADVYTLTKEGKFKLLGITEVGNVRLDL